MATQDYQITNTLLQSLFGPSPEQQAQAYQKARDQQAMQVAQLTPGRGAVFAGSQIAQDLGQSAQQLGGAVRRGVFGIETPKEIEDNVVNQIKQKGQEILRSGDMAAYADFLATEYAKAGLTDRAVRAKTAAEQFTMQQKEQKAGLELKQAQAKKATAEPAEKMSNAAMQVKELVSMGVPQSVAIKAAYKLPDAEQTGERVNNNGIPVGTFDKVGRYKAADGSVYSNKAYTDAQSGHDAANDLLYKLSNLTKEDIVNAYGSGTDYTTMPGGGLYSRTLGSTKTYDAQVKINEIGIRNVLNNLQQLKGPSSDKEMAQMIKDFPGFTAKPSVMENWVKRAVKSTNRFLNRSEKRYGFDTDYLVPKWVQEEPRTPKANEVPPSGQPAQTPLGTMQNPIKLD